MPKPPGGGYKTVYLYAKNGDTLTPVAGATVRVSGCGLLSTKFTNSNGAARFYLKASKTGTVTPRLAERLRDEVDHAALPRALDGSDNGDFDEGSGRQARDLDGRPRGEVWPDVLRVHLVHRRKVGEIDDEDGDVQSVREA